MAKAVITLEDLPNHQYQISVIFLPPTNGGWEKTKNSAAVAQAVHIMNDSFKPSGVSMRMIDGGFEIKKQEKEMKNIYAVQLKYLDGRSGMTILKASSEEECISMINASSRGEIISIKNKSEFKEQLNQIESEE